jgi:hypothetical protein
MAGWQAGFDDLYLFGFFCMPDVPAQIPIPSSSWQSGT